MFGGKGWCLGEEVSVRVRVCLCVHPCNTSVLFMCYLLVAHVRMRIRKRHLCMN